MKIWRQAVLFYLGGMGYMGLELLWRGWSHGSMFVLGGVCFLVIGWTGDVENMLIPVRTLLCGCLITGLELLAGLILNVYLGWHIWDYSGVRWQFMGQICAPYFFLWNLVAFWAIWIDRWLRRALFHLKVPPLPDYMMLRRRNTAAGPL